ncbi:site-specific DNA-methyltransferase [uncultured Caulobacter sp.]|uniref:site-specific DNA-methyltransferase n=1 Tax=uncultured Caulobacter sp. TaxID=158749 RepID=UPI00260C6304|nr:site-specific DNA-methyltransferase [uncultured Caulobacter sp.]
MSAKTKLELTWIGKDHRPRLEPRILIEEERLSHHSAARREGDFFDNVLIRGDNLLGLKALESAYAGKIKCVFIDPPYNTGSAFEQYDDGLEHSVWLSLMRDRLEIIRNLLSEDGSLWVSLDDNEAHYFKVMCDGIFGRENFISDISWQKRDGPPNDRKIGSTHDHILVWGRTKQATSKKTKAEEAFNLMPRTEKADSQYQVFAEPDGPDERGAFRKIDTTANGKGGRFVQSLFYPIKNPYTGQEVWPRQGTCWRHSKEEMQRLQDERRLFWGAKGTATTPMRKLFKTEAKQGMSAPSIWTDVGLNQHASAQMEALFGEKAAFETPKPEQLLARIITIATKPGDIVLDSFAGSGTTGAVAHKMGRRWIMVELGEHCENLIVPRMRKVIDGNDQSGITEAVGWKGGGGFRYFKLAPSLLEKDQFGNWVISKSYNAEMLAEAMCKHFGFNYAPSPEYYWMHGHSSEADFIYVTTNSLTHEQLAAISEDVGPDRSLLICCKAFQGGNADAFGNLTIRKIPGAILDRCEWGKDDYSLKIEALPFVEDEPEEEQEEGGARPRRSVASPNQPGLFGGDEEAEA